MSRSKSVGGGDRPSNTVILDALEERGDPRAAWDATALCIAEGLPFPGWVVYYLASTATALLDHLDNRDLRHPLNLVRALGFDDLIKPDPYDPDRDPEFVYERITTWRATGEVKNISEGARRYHAEFLRGAGSPETVRVLFHEGKKRVTR